MNTWVQRVAVLFDAEGDYFGCELVLRLWLALEVDENSAMPYSSAHCVASGV